MKMDAVLVNLPSSEVPSSESYIRSIPPIGLGYIAQYAENNGFQVSILDMDAERLSISQAVERICQSDPRYIGVNCYSSGLDICLKLIKELSKLGYSIVVGGAHPTACYEDFLELENVYIVRGYGEKAFVEILRGTQNYLKHKVISDYELSQEITELLVSPQLYSNYTMEFENGEVIEACYVTSRGCPYTCTYCMSANSPYLIKNIDNVAMQIKQDIELFNVNSAHFLDDIIFLSNKSIKRFIDVSKKMNIYGKFRWRGLLSIPVMQKLHVELVEESNCSSISVGVESGSDRLIRLAGKKYSKTDVLNCFKHYENSKIKFKVFFMIGLPTETDEDIKETRELILALKGIGCISDVNVFQYKPYPGTALFEQYFQNITLGFSHDDMRDRLTDSDHDMIAVNLAKETHFCEHSLLSYNLDFYKAKILELYRLFYN